MAVSLADDCCDDSKDAGQSAALEVLGVSLGECLVPLLGEGDWEPPEPAEDSGDPEA